MVLDGSERVDEILRAAIPWDTMIGVSREELGKMQAFHRDSSRVQPGR